MRTRARRLRQSACPREGLRDSGTASRAPSSRARACNYVRPSASSTGVRFAGGRRGGKHSRGRLESRLGASSRASLHVNARAREERRERACSGTGTPADRSRVRSLPPGTQARGQLRRSADRVEACPLSRAYTRVRAREARDERAGRESCPPAVSSVVLPRASLQHHGFYDCRSSPHGIVREPVGSAFRGGLAFESPVASQGRQARGTDLRGLAKRIRHLGPRARQAVGWRFAAAEMSLAGSTARNVEEILAKETNDYQ
jgi:hypothetical protein